MPRHSCRGALFWSFRYGYATYWNLGGTLFPTYSLLTLLGAAAAWLYFHRQLKARGEKPRPDRASLSLWSSGGIGRRKISLPAAPAAPAAPGPPPCWQPIRPPFPPATSRVGSSLWRAVRRSGRGLAVLPAAQGPLLPAGGRPGPPASPLFHTFGRVGCFLAGCCYGIPAPPAGQGVTFRVSPVAPNGVALLPRPAV